MKVGDVEFGLRMDNYGLPCEYNFDGMAEVIEVEGEKIVFRPFGVPTGTVEGIEMPGLKVPSIIVGKSRGK
jgi:hypothetical protein